MTTTYNPRDEIQKLLDKASSLIQEAEEIAKTHSLSFSWDGPAYGMGGYYSAEPEWQASTGCEWETSDSDEVRGWMASSQSC